MGTGSRTPAGAVLVSHQFPAMMHLQIHFSGYFKPRSDIFSTVLDSKKATLVPLPLSKNQHFFLFKEIFFMELMAS